VTAFVPILVATQLPPPGAPEATEGHTLDFKQWHHGIAIPALEAARDIAAFANASGGALIYGATANGLALEKYEGKSEAEAIEWCDDLSLIVSQRLGPPPIVLSKHFLEANSGTWVVVANVYPSTGQAVGVRVKADEWTDPSNSSAKKKDWSAYLFPLRTGEDTIPLNPEQTSMLMIPQLRRTVSLLRQIGDAQRVFLQVGEAAFHECRLTDLNELANRLVLKPLVPPSPRAQRVVGFDGPLDDVECVWSSSENNQHVWRIRVRFRGYSTIE